MRWSGISQGKLAFFPTKDASTPFVTSVARTMASPRSRSLRTAGSAGRLSSPTSGTPRRSTRSGGKRSSFADARLPTSSTRPRRRSGRRWSTSLVWTPSRVFGRICSARETTFARKPKPRRKRRGRISARLHRDPRTSARTRFSQACRRSAGCSVSIHRSLSIRWRIRRGSRPRFAPVPLYQRLRTARVFSPRSRHSALQPTTSVRSTRGTSSCRRTGHGFSRAPH